MVFYYLMVDKGLLVFQQYQLQIQILNFQNFYLFYAKLNKTKV